MENQKRKEKKDFNPKNLWKFCHNIRKYLKNSRNVPGEHLKKILEKNIKQPFENNRVITELFGNLKKIVSFFLCGERQYPPLVPRAQPPLSPSSLFRFEADSLGSFAQDHGANKSHLLHLARIHLGPTKDLCPFLFQCRTFTWNVNRRFFF